jgi:NAD(P)-dependent dehydrogenase (short-subunit alcohol dehydrogenase family)
MLATAKPMQRIFITGASSGLGLATARALTARGHEVWGSARDPAQLPPSLPHFHSVRLDLNQPESIAAGFGQALREAGHFDVLINNAGSGLFGPLEAFSDHEFEAQLATLLVGPFQLIRLALPSMRVRNAGLLINVSSLAGEFPVPFMAPYSLAKAALSAMSEALGLELAHTGIRVIDVRPGDYATQFHSSMRRVGAELADAYAPAVERAWHTIDRNMGAAPDSQAVADALLALVEGRRHRPVVALGSLFQARIAPVLARLSPRAWVQWGQRQYYGLRRGP